MAGDILRIKTFLVGEASKMTYVTIKCEPQINSFCKLFKKSNWMFEGNFGWEEVKSPGEIDFGKKVNFIVNAGRFTFWAAS